MCQKKYESDPWYANDECRQRVIQTLLLAARSGYTNIVRCILQLQAEDSEETCTLLNDSISTTGPKLWMQAVIEGLASVYKVYS
jgi:hypothetical protein